MNSSTSLRQRSILLVRPSERLGRVFGELKEYKHILVFLIAYFFYIDGVHTIIGMATSYGKDVGISDNNL